jgi:small subunit ribosomal protein S4e
MKKNSALLFDTLTIVPSKKNYRIIFNEKGKFALEEISEEDAEKKISKIINKKILNGKKIQINLSDGRNLLYDGKFNIGDSAILNLKNKKIEKIIPLKEGSQVIIYSGKHSGKKGIVEKIEKEKKMAILKYKQERINVLNKQLMAIE